MAEQKQYEPSKKKLEQARERGQNLKATAFYQLVSLLGAILGGWLGYKFFCLGQPKLLEYQLLGLNFEAELAIAVGGRVLIGITLSALGLAVLVSILVQVAHLGFIFRGKLLAPTAARLDPVQGLAKVFGGIKNFWQIALKISLVGLIIFLFCRENLIELRPGSIELVSASVVKMLGQLIAVVLGLSALDYWIQRRRYLHDLSMSLADLRREHKESEGDPLLKHSRRLVHEALAQQDVAERVKRATVVVVDRV